MNPYPGYPSYVPAPGAYPGQYPQAVDPAYAYQQNYQYAQPAAPIPAPGYGEPAAYYAGAAPPAQPGYYPTQAPYYDPAAAATGYNPTPGYPAPPPAYAPPLAGSQGPDLSLAPPAYTPPSPVHYQQPPPGPYASPLAASQGPDFSVPPPAYSATAPPSPVHYQQPPPGPPTSPQVPPPIGPSVSCGSLVSPGRYNRDTFAASHGHGHGHHPAALHSASAVDLNHPHPHHLLSSGGSSASLASDWSRSQPQLSTYGPPPVVPPVHESPYMYGVDYYQSPAALMSMDSVYGAAYQSYVPAGVSCHDPHQFANRASIALASAIQTETYALLSHGLLIDSGQSFYGGAPMAGGAAPSSSSAATTTTTNIDVNKYSDEDLRRFLQTHATFKFYQLAGRPDDSQAEPMPPRDVTVYLNTGGVHLHVDRDCVSLADIEAVRLGRRTTVLKKTASVDTQLAFSIHSGTKSWSMTAYTREQFDLWVNGIIRLVAGLRELTSDFAYVKGMWAKSGKDKQSTADVRILLATMGLHAPPHLIDEFAAQPEFVLDFGSFVRLLRRCRERPVIRELFNQNSTERRMSAVQLLAFARTEQHEAEWSMETAEQMISQFGSDGAMSYEGFETYLTTAKANSWENPMTRHVYQDMTRPLHEYYISSSHNTYLEGNQLTSRSSTEMYERVLKTGCRCIELDLHDGPEGPIITHGGTLTSKLQLRDVLAVIKQFAFYASEYPLVLSLENHTTPPQQAQVAALLTEYLGEMLAPSTQLLQPGMPLPSPEQLKHRVLVKGPMHPAAGTPAPPAAHRMNEEFARLIHLGPAGSMAVDGSLPPYRMTSLSEKKLRSVKTSETVRFAQRHLVRTYPAGNRIDSSNPDPTDSWIVGCQMAALNYQDPATPLLLNIVRFTDNGGCGYILKPYALRADEAFDPFTLTKPIGASPMGIYIRVLSARQLPPLKDAQQSAPSIKNSAKKVFTALGRKLTKPPIADTPEFAPMAVQIEVHGVPSDRQKQRTSAVPNSEYGPNWDTTFHFQFNAPELAVITISIMQVSTFDYKICHAGIPVLSLRQGYRIIPMREAGLKYLPMTDLLCISQRDNS